MTCLLYRFLSTILQKATSPVKLFEYMALNKPIVTTDMDECRKYKSVLIGHSRQEFIELLDHAMSLYGNEEYMQLLNKEALEIHGRKRQAVYLKSLRSMRISRNYLNLVMLCLYYEKSVQKLCDR